MRDTVLILDFGSQYSHLIARRVRELNVYCRMQPGTDPLQLDDPNDVVKGVILSGGPSSVYQPEAPHTPDYVWTLGVPVLGVCYGLQDMAQRFGGEVTAIAHREFGHADLSLTEAGSGHPLLAGLQNSSVWMSHGDQVTKTPVGWQTLAFTPTCPNCVLCSSSNLFGVQFHPEVTHSVGGKRLFSNFVDICGAARDWSMESFLDQAIRTIRAQVGETAHCLGACSGGVDSTVAAALMNRAIGSRFHAMFINNGVLRLNESSQVVALMQECGINLHVVDASSTFIGNLKGVTDPEQKRKIIGGTFVEVFQEQAKALGAEMQFLVQGTLYPDVIESNAHGPHAVVIKSHHNVGGLLKNMSLKLVEPLRFLFKDEVRALGRVLGLPEHVVDRHPFPGPGLAVRILGEVTQEQTEILKKADAIFLEELRVAGLYHEIAQAFAVLLPVRSVGVMGDCRTYEQVCALRAVTSSDFMTADWYPMPTPCWPRFPAVLSTRSEESTEWFMIFLPSLPPPLSGNRWCC
eukprot:gnl/Hemi2/6177_TR2128_c0_g6_i1.p1 gnl/Hemi2/6177_TR2128_c0_g6~~gnl/Hemi2/6177_TR2128_c0_g6_i1.p1  ORF type:complete len:518 (+),score=-0.89 gnl/Hemi2/6177_TR2128_c0_g6_i1:35-1588(+)